MTYGYQEIEFDGQTCWNCGKDLHGESAMLDDNCFCSERCLGAYLIEKYDDVIQWVDVKTTEEIRQRQLEDYNDQKRDK